MNQNLHKPEGTGTTTQLNITKGVIVVNSLKKLVAVAVALTLGLYGVGMIVASAQEGKVAADAIVDLQPSNVIDCAKSFDGQVATDAASAGAAAVTKTKTLNTTNEDVTIQYQLDKSGPCGNAPDLIELNLDNAGD